MKEQLTEHLYTIIHQNEIRKSQKLAQLMKELEMETSADDIEPQVDLPPLSSFNMMQTLSPTKIRQSPSSPTAGGDGSKSKMADNSAKSHQGSQPQSDSYPQPMKSTEKSEAESQPIKNLDPSMSDILSGNKTQISRKTQQTFSDQEKERSTLPKLTKEQESPVEAEGHPDQPAASPDATDVERRQQELSNQ